MARQLGAALEFLAKRYGGLLREIETTPSVGIAAGLLIGFNAERVSVVFVNLSANNVFIGPKADVSATKGLQVLPSGGAIAINVEEDGTLPTNEWHAIASGAGSAMYVLEVVREIILEVEGGTP